MIELNLCPRCNNNGDLWIRESSIGATTEYRVKCLSCDFMTTPHYGPDAIDGAVNEWNGE